MIDYVVSTLTLGAIWCVFTYALNVSWGWTGQLDLAVFMYVAIGAYVYSVICGPPSPSNPALSVTWILGLRLPFIFGLLGAMLVAGVWGLIVGGIALRRLRDDYLAITTVVTTLTAYAVIAQYQPLFNGFTGIYGVPQPLSKELNLPPTLYGIFLFALVLAILALVFVSMEAIFRSPYGRVMRAVREDEKAAAAFGRNVYAVKLQAYVIAAVVAGLGGALLGAFLTAFNAYAWQVGETFLIYAAIFIGGSGSTRGVLLGTFFIAVFVQEVTRLFVVIPGNAYAGDAIRYMIVGLLIITILWLRPEGVIPEPRDKDEVSGSASPDAGKVPAVQHG